MGSIFSSGGKTPGTVHLRQERRHLPEPGGILSLGGWNSASPREDTVWLLVFNTRHAPFPK